MTGKPYPIGDLRPGLPHEVHQILNRMMEKRPEDRYPTPRHLADALDQYLSPAVPGASVPAPHSIAETPPVAETPIPGVPRRAPAPSSGNPLRETVPVPSHSLRDTMPIPPGFAESLAV